MELTLLSVPPTPIRRWLILQLRALVGRNRKEEAGASSARVRGPQIVQRNLEAGLCQLGYPFRVNPATFQVTPWVGVLSHPGALNWAIRAKRRGQIRRLLAGPNLVVTPYEADGILRSPEIDLVVTPCRWVSQKYASMAPELIGKLAEWPVGVDTELWSPLCAHRPVEGRNWLVYDKTSAGGQQVREKVLQTLQARCESYRVLVYDQYSPEEYRNALQHATAMIVLSPHESQGIAQFEAWSCNVPTLVWDKRRWEWRDLVFEHPDVSSSPYLTEECGMRFTGAEDFEFTFDEFVGQLGGFTPRDYVLSHFTLAKSAQAYVSLMYGGGL